MRKISYLFLLLPLFLLLACDNDEGTGLIIQPEKDKISVYADTVGVTSSNFFVEKISAQIDTLLLGEYYDAKFGLTKGEIIVQLAPPVDYEFPPEANNPQPDSLVLYMYYRTWFGLSNTPLEISIYELNKKTPDYSTTYYTNLDVSEFTDKSVMMGKKLITSVDQTLTDSARKLSTYVPTVRYKCTPEQTARFFNLPKEAYASEKNFCQHFKGMYITTTYGSSTVLHLSGIEMKLFYHYTYNKNGKDTVVNTSIIYPANSEVRQLNKLSHPEIETTIKLCDSVNYIKSAAGMYPKLQLPVGEMRKRIFNRIDTNKIVSINSAVLTVEAVKHSSLESALPVPDALMLIRESQIDDFIDKNRIPGTKDTTAVLGYYNSTNGSYMFDLAYFLDKEIMTDPYNFTELENVLLVPVNVSVNSSYQIIGVKAQSKIQGVAVRSGKNSVSHMKIRFMYSGF